MDIHSLGRLAAKDIRTVYWNPPKHYSLALEVITAKELFRRVNPKHFGHPHRVDFYMLVGVSESQTTHTIDFSKIHADVGTWMLLRPGQMQQFEPAKTWDGWIVILRPEFLPSDEKGRQSVFFPLCRQFDDFPSAIKLNPAEHAECCSIAETMQSDSGLDASEHDRSALLLYQMWTLLTRLSIALSRTMPVDNQHNGHQARVARFRAAVEEHFRTQHSAVWYASLLGCSIKTLSRSTQAITGKNAKILICERITLEAKRQLVHSLEPILNIADDLGFDEPSNFVKYFKREVGCAPKVFRERH